MREPAADDLGRALRSIVPLHLRAHVGVGARLIGDADIDGLHAEELAAVASAMPVRRREFATGRTLLRELIGTDVAIPMAASRRPVLPAGVVATLAHDRATAVAAVSRHPAIASMGIDVEPDDQLPPAMARSILRPDETQIDAHLAFVLKEATYKAWSVLGGAMLEHHDVRVTIEDGVFWSEVRPPSGLDRRGGAPADALTYPVSWGDVVSGRYTNESGRWLALLIIGA